MNETFNSFIVRNNTTLKCAGNVKIGSASKAGCFTSKNTERIAEELKIYLKRVNYSAVCRIRKISISFGSTTLHFYQDCCHGTFRLSLTRLIVQSVSIDRPATTHRSRC
jgi:hypothetical protein